MTRSRKYAQDEARDFKSRLAQTDVRHVRSGLLGRRHIEGRGRGGCGIAGDDQNLPSDSYKALRYQSGVGAPREKLRYRDVMCLSDSRPPPAFTSCFQGLGGCGPRTANWPLVDGSGGGGLRGIVISGIFFIRRYSWRTSQFHLGGRRIFTRGPVSVSSRASS